MGFDHMVSAKKIAEIFEETFCKHLLEMPKKSTYTLIRSGAIDRVYLVYLYVCKPEDIFKFKSWITEELYLRWDEERTKRVNKQA
jgi:hypothetical protein